MVLQVCTSELDVLDRYDFFSWNVSETRRVQNKIEHEHLRLTQFARINMRQKFLIIKSFDVDKDL